MKFSILGNIDADSFIREYWQQKPLLIRQALTGFQSPLSPDELAGLALEEDVRSRIIQQASTEPPQWRCQHGPFTEDSFAHLPETHWTLLVQDVEKIRPELSSLLDYFLFLPRWRIDDLMVSYAAPEGSVGPHTDQYDVFLLQGIGRRRWQIQENNVRQDNLQDNPDLQILEQFEAEQEWTLEPGDMLYLPPGVAHYGIAEGECMTYSIGFRAPSNTELIQAVAEAAVSELKDRDRYTDQMDAAVTHPGELNGSTIDRLQQNIIRVLEDKALVSKALGGLLSEPSDILPELPEMDLSNADEFKQLLQSCQSVHIHPAVKMLYIENQTGITWYIDGEAYPVTGKHTEQVKSLADQYRLDGQLACEMCLDETILLILFNLYKQGGLIVNE